jgi:hypothetical protein
MLLSIHQIQKYPHITAHNITELIITCVETYVEAAVGTNTKREGGGLLNLHCLINYMQTDQSNLD